MRSVLSLSSGVTNRQGPFQKFDFSSFGFLLFQIHFLVEVLCARLCAPTDVYPISYRKRNLVYPDCMWLGTRDNCRGLSMVDVRLEFLLNTFLPSLSSLSLEFNFPPQPGFSRCLWEAL